MNVIRSRCSFTGGHALDYKAFLFLQYLRQPRSILKSFDMYFNNLIYSIYFTFFSNWKTVNQFKIHLVYLLADKNEYIDDSFVVVLSQKR